MYNGMH
jgi:hypothetical protein